MCPDCLPSSNRPDDRLFTQPAYQLKLKDMWGVYANYKRARVATMGNILQKWRLLTAFHKASKQFREHAKLAKRDKITRVAGELAEASARGDQRGLWQGAKKLAPWKPRTKMSIRGPELRVRFFHLRNNYRPFLIIARASFAMGTRISRSTE